MNSFSCLSLNLGAVAIEGAGSAGPGAVALYSCKSLHWPIQHQPLIVGDMEEQSPREQEREVYCVNILCHNFLPATEY